MFKTISVAPGYEIDKDGKVRNKKTNTPVFPDKTGKKVQLFTGKGKERKQFEVAKLTQSAWGETEKPVVKEKPATTKEAGKPGRKGSVIAEIRTLFAKGKTKQQVIELGKYNKSTIGVQWGKFNKEQNA